MDLEKRLMELRERKERALMTHVYYGDPTPEFSRQLIRVMAESGADLVELGIPFSDPTADGPTFQAACERALRSGVTPMDCIRGIRELRENGLETPLILTTYYNIPYVMGIENFLDKIKAAEAQGVIVPNLPYEEAKTLLYESKRRGVYVILQVAPTTTEDRLKRIVDAASGFIYALNVEGVTGTRESLGDDCHRIIERVRRYSDIPVLAGFGISNREQAETVISAGADGVIAGSVFAKIYEGNLENPKVTLPEIARLVKEMKCAHAESVKV